MSLMKKLDEFIATIYPDKPKKIKVCCPSYKRVLSPNLLLYACENCGMVLKENYEVYEYGEYKGNYVRTYMNYNPNMRGILRLHKWINYDRMDVIVNDYIKSFNDYDFDKEVIRKAKVLFKDEFKSLKIRGKVKKGFICYCFYKSHLLNDYPVDIDLLFKYFDITQNNYNDAVKKLNDKIFYPHNLKYYLKQIKQNINKNKFIKDYNKYKRNNNEFNNKTLILGLLCKYLKIENDKKQLDEFIRKFNISDNSLFLVSCYLKQN